MRRPADSKMDKVNWKQISQLTNNTFTYLAYVAAHSGSTFDFDYKINNVGNKVLFMFKQITDTGIVRMKILAFNNLSYQVTCLDLTENEMKAFIALSDFSESFSVYENEYALEAEDVIKKSLIDYSLDTDNQSMLSELSSKDWKAKAIASENNIWDTSSSED